MNGYDEKTEFGWSMVRILGELQVLTKASYVMLILIPLLAGTWPAVTIVVNRYNDSIQTATEKLDIASEKINLLSENDNIKVLNPSIQEITESLKSEIEALEKGIRKTSIEDPTLPNVWVWAFLASLAAVLGHTVYQVAAPTVIRRSSEREFINEMIEDDKTLNPIVNNERLEQFDNGERIRVVVLEARKKYQYSSKDRKVGSVVSIILYFASILMIAIVVVSQTISVLKAAGWI